MPFLVSVSLAFALDALDNEDPIVGEILEFCRMRAYQPAISPSIGVSLLDRFRQTDDSEVKELLASIILGKHQITSPTLDPINRDRGIIDNARVIVEGITNELIGKLEIGGDLHRQFLARIIAESAVMRAKYLILEDQEFMFIDLPKVEQILRPYRLNGLQIVSRIFFYGFVSGHQE